MEYLLFLQNAREALGGTFNNIALWFTSLGEPILTYIILAIMYWCVDKNVGQLMAWNVSLACTSNQFIKWKFKIERPWVIDNRITPVEGALEKAGGYAFPSGHTTRAMANWGAIGFAEWKKRRTISILCYVIVITVAFSRNFLGVHTSLDVIYALIIGMIILALTSYALEWCEKGKNRDIILAIAGCVICFVPMLFAGCLSNAGAGIGFIVGWLIEKRFVNFTTLGTKREVAAKILFGSIGIAVILYPLNSMLCLFMESKYAGFFDGFILGIFIMAGFPFFFKERSREKIGVVLSVLIVCCITAGAVYGQHRIEVQNQQMQAEAQEEPVVEEYIGPKVIAHRGYSSQYPENTLSAFQASIDAGVDMVELDVQMSKDGVIMVFHDDTLARITGAEGTIADYTREELQAMDAGGWFGEAFVGEKIPTLEEVLGLLSTSELGVYLELKDIGEVDGFVQKVYEAAQNTGMADRCIYASFNYNYLQQFKALDESSKILYNTLTCEVTLPEEYPADYYGVNIAAVNEEGFEAIHNAQSQVYVWTVNTPEEVDMLVGMKVDGVVTNYAGFVKRCIYSVN